MPRLSSLQNALGRPGFTRKIWPTGRILTVFKWLIRFVPALASVQNDFAMIKLSFPFSEKKIRALKVGDEVLISGVVFTGRS
jgi:hypothetical protein